MKRQIKLVFAAALIALGLLAGANVAEQASRHGYALKAAPTLTEEQPLASAKVALPPPNLGGW